MMQCSFLPIGVNVIIEAYSQFQQKFAAWIGRKWDENVFQHQIM